MRFEATQTRLQTSVLVNLQLAENDKLEPHELWQLPWDEPQEPKNPQLTEAEIISHNNKLLNALDNL